LSRRLKAEIFGEYNDPAVALCSKTCPSLVPKEAQWKHLNRQVA